MHLGQTKPESSYTWSKDERGAGGHGRVALKQQALRRQEPLASVLAQREGAPGTCHQLLDTLPPPLWPGRDGPHLSGAGQSLALRRRAWLCPLARVMLYFSMKLLTASELLTDSRRQMVLNNLLLLISQENMKKEYRLAILSQRGLRERIITFLTMQASRIQDTTIRISFSREELASYLCVNRSALSHELSMMQREGLITFRKNSFRLHKI